MSATDSPSKLPLILAGVLVLLGVGRCYLVAESSSGIDYFHFWAVPEMVRTSESSVYDSAKHDSLLDEFRLAQIDGKLETPAGKRLQSWLAENQQHYATGMHPTGSPFFYLTNGLVRTGEVVIDFWIFQTVSTMLFVIGIWLIGLAFGCKPANSLFFAAAMLFLHRGLQSDVGVANANRIQIGLFGLSMWCLFRHELGSSTGVRVGWYLGGLILGLAAAYKPNVVFAPVLICFALAVDWRWKHLFATFVGIGLGIGVAVVAGAWFFGTADCWWQWRNYLETITRNPFDIDSGNYSLTRLWCPVESLGLVSVLSTLALTGLCCLVLWKSRSSNLAIRRYVLAGSVGLLIPLLTGPVTWGHYFVLSMPLAMVLAFWPGVDNRFSVSRQRALASGMFGLVLTGLVPISLFSGVTPELILISLQIGLGILLLGALVLIRDVDSA